MRTLIKLSFEFLIIAVVVLFCAAIFESFLTSETIEIKVSNLHIKSDKNGTKNYFIYTETETFANKNNYYHGKSNQEEIMKLLKKKKSYRVKVVGYKLGFEVPYFFTEHRNLVKIVN